MKLVTTHILTMLCLCPPLALAQEAPAHEDGPATMQTLINEVRQLRIAVERAATVLPQTQILLQRAQLQQQRVESLSRQLDQLRDQIAHSASEDARLAAGLKQFESRMEQEQDASRRREMQNQLEQVKAQLADDATGDQQRRARESDLAARLQNEQAALNELNDRLDALSRQIAPPPPAKP